MPHERSVRTALVPTTPEWDLKQQRYQNVGFYVAKHPTTAGRHITQMQGVPTIAEWELDGVVEPLRAGPVLLFRARCTSLLAACDPSRGGVEVEEARWAQQLGSYRHHILRDAK